MKYKVLAAVMAAFLMLPAMTATAYAGGGEQIPETTESAVAEQEQTAKPFTPSGTGTVVDNATDGDGKEFFTITTPDENVFYLIIDRQRSSENVYFLNAVTEKDLLALAEKSEDTGESVSAIPDNTGTSAVVEPTPEPEPTPTPDPKPQKGGGMGMMIMIVLVVLAGSGAGYYFKIYRPKQQKADMEDDFDYGENEGDAYGKDDDSPPWDEDNTGEDGDE